MLDERIALLEAGIAADRQRSAAVLSSCATWPAVRDVLLWVAAEKPPTLVYGDYDADGVISSFLLQRWLRSRGVPGNVFLPSRFRHGYGLSEATVKQALDHGYRALLVLDCGTANHAEVEMALAGGLQVAIIDHHEPKAALPAAPLLNPHLETALPPRCTAGLVYDVLSALYAAGTGEPYPDEVELAGLATLADVVPLQPRNWLLAHESLSLIPETPNLGLAELTKVSGLHGLTRLTSQQLNYQLIPRLNAVGRLRSPKLAYDLLAADSRETAANLARQVDGLNQERKLVADQVTRQALLQALEHEDEPALALYDPDWSIGVLGLVAARVAEQLGKATVVFTDAPVGEGLLSGSVRTVSGVDVVQALKQCGDTLQSYGGHAQAAGVKVQSERLDDFRRAWAAAVAQASGVPLPAEPEAPPEVQLHELTAQFEEDIWRLAPFGPGYPAPRCVIGGVQVARVGYMGRDKLHVNLLISDGVREARLAGFNLSHLVERLHVGLPVSPSIEIDADNWNNRLTIVLRLLGIADSHGAQGARNQSRGR